MLIIFIFHDRVNNYKQTLPSWHYKSNLKPRVAFHNIFKTFFFMYKSTVAVMWPVPNLILKEKCAPYSVDFSGHRS